MNADEARRLADKIRFTREEITEKEWWQIADIVARDKRPPRRPVLDDADREANRVQRAQHQVAWDVLEWQKIYRQRNNCRGVPDEKTEAALHESIQIEARWFRVAPELLSVEAVRNIIKNKRPSIRAPRRPSFSSWHTNPYAY